MKTIKQTIKYWTPVILLSVVLVTMLTALFYFAFNGKCIRGHIDTKTNPFVVGEYQVLICERWGL